MESDELVLVEHGLSMSLESPCLESPPPHPVPQAQANLDQHSQIQPWVTRATEPSCSSRYQRSQFTTFVPNLGYKLTNIPHDVSNKAPRSQILQSGEQRHSPVPIQSDVEEKVEPIGFPYISGLPQRLKDVPVEIREYNPPRQPQVSTFLSSPSR
jgi:hypothetical protein